MDSETPRGQRVILVVDDEPDLCDLLAFELEGAGYSTKVANSGPEALAIVQQHTIDLIISDIRMPGMDGLTMLKELGASAAKIPPVIFVTGYADISLVDAFDSGAVAIFAKPVEYEALMRAVSRCVEPDLVRRSGKIRVDASLSIDLKVDSACFKCNTVNVGRGGAFIATVGKMPPIGSKLSFKIRFEDGIYSPLEGVATVRWHRSNTVSNLPAGMGIEFEELTPTARKNLVLLINDLQSNSYIPKC